MKVKLIKVFSQNNPFDKDDYERAEYQESLTDWEELSNSQLDDLKRWVELKNASKISYGRRGRIYRTDPYEKYVILVECEKNIITSKALKEYAELAKKELKEEEERKRKKKETAKKRAETSKKRKLEKLAKEVEDLAKSQSKSMEELFEDLMKK